MQGQSRPFIATEFPKSSQEVHKQSYLLLSKSNWKRQHTSSWSTRLDERIAYKEKWRIVSRFSTVAKKFFTNYHNRQFVNSGKSKEGGGVNHPRPNVNVNDAST